MPLTPETDVNGPYEGKGNDNEWGEKHADILRRIMAADFTVVGEHYDRACHLSLSGGRDVHSSDAATAFWLGLRSAFPSADFKIELLICVEN